MDYKYLLKEAKQNFKLLKNLGVKNIGCKDCDLKFRTIKESRRHKCNGIKIYGCQRCGLCCVNYPCYLEPKDLFKISKFLDITINELIDKYLIIDYYTEGIKDLYYLTPRRVNTNRRFASWGFSLSDSPCIFLGKNCECLINDVKPRGGREYECWDNEKKVYTRKDAGILWKKYMIYEDAGFPEINLEKINKLKI